MIEKEFSQKRYVFAHYKNTLETDDFTGWVEWEWFVFGELFFEEHYYALFGVA
jgi:hypothetical protein